MTELISYSALEEIKLQWLAMIDTIEDPLVLIDTNYQIIRENQAYLKTIKARVPKINFNNLNGKKCYEFFANRTSPCQHCQVSTLNLKAKDAEWITSQLIENKTYSIRAHKMLSDTNSEATRFVIHYRDITVEDNLLKALSHTEKLAAIGKLAGGVAHEINSPLAAILAFSQVVLSEIEKNSPYRSDLEQIEIAAKKCKEIVENLLSFSRQENKMIEQKPFHLLEEIQNTLKLANGLLQKQRIKVIWNIHHETHDLIQGSPGQIGQVFLNLITNAIQAIKNGGVIEFRRFDEKNFICIEVADSGCGIDAKIINKIFEPFFTTKTVGEGTGLGLSISYSLVKQHGGEISVSSTSNEGTVFVVKLPKNNKINN